MRNVTLDRVEFEQRQQLEGEYFNGFFVAIQKIALDADLFEDRCQDCTKRNWDLRMATKTVSGMRDSETKAKCLAIKNEEFNLEKVVDVCRTEETSRKNERNLSGNQVNRISNGQDNRSRRIWRGKPTQKYGQDFEIKGPKSESKKEDGCRKQCFKCGNKHVKNQCPAKEKSVIIANRSDIMEDVVSTKMRVVNRTMEKGRKLGKSP